MAKQKTAVAEEVLQLNNITAVSARVKKDMLWVIVSIVVSLGVGLAVGSFFKF